MLSVSRSTLTALLQPYYAMTGGASNDSNKPEWPQYQPLRSNSRKGKKGTIASDDFFVFRLVFSFLLFVVCLYMPRPCCLLLLALSLRTHHRQHCSRASGFCRSISLHEGFTFLIFIVHHRTPSLVHLLVRRHSCLVSRFPFTSLSLSAPL